jgi:hypothetical protein
MHNQHQDLSQALAEQRMTERHEQATHARLGRGPGRLRRPSIVAQLDGGSRGASRSIPGDQ